jgi:cell division septum initiation protein DivIVA
MPKPNMRISPAHIPDRDELQRENEMLRREIADLRAQIAATHTGIKAVLDAATIQDQGSTS